VLTALAETVVLVLVVVVVVVVVVLAGLALVVVVEPGAENGADAALAQPPVVSAISATMSAANRRPAPGAGRRGRCASAHVDAEEVAILRGEVALV